MLIALIVIACVFGYGIGGSLLYRECERRWKGDGGYQWQTFGSVNAVIASILWPLSAAFLLPRWTILRIEAWREARRPVEPMPQGKGAYR